jgi:ATP-dependent helicase/nuclease subunit A
LPQLKVIRASAGSGKTYTLSGEYLRLLFTETDYFRHILAVTFTNKATNEMKSRIVHELDVLASDKESAQLADLMASTGLTEKQLRNKASIILKRLLHHYSDFSISTIDAFFQRIIRSFTRELGLQGTYSIELDTESLLTAVIDRLLLESETDSALLKWLGDYAGSLIERGENWNLRNSMRTLGKEIFREEFKSLSTRVAAQYGNREFLKNFQHELFASCHAIEKEYRAFGQEAMISIDNAGLTVDDFYMKGRGPAGFLFRLAAGEFKEPTETANNVSLNPEKWSSRSSPHAPAIGLLAVNELMPLMQRAINYYNSHSRHYFTLDVVLKNMYTLGILADLSRLAYEWCNENNAFLLPEAPLFLQKIIDGNETPFIYEKAGYWYHHFMIDEFQDTSLLQWLNFKPLISNSLSQHYDNLVVGDVKQSIYRWRNSDWRILANGVADDFPGGIIDNRALAYNWRSGKNIIDFNNRFFHDAAFLLEQDFMQTLGQEGYPISQFGETPIRKMYADIIQKPGNENNPDGIVRISFIGGDSELTYYEQANARLIGLLCDLQDAGYKPGDIAIITRKNKEAKQLADFLLTYQVENPATLHRFNVISDEALRLGSSSVVVFLAALLQHLADPGDQISTYYILSFYLEHGQDGSATRVRPMPASDASERIRQLEQLMPPEFLELCGSASALSLAEVVERLIAVFGLSRFRGEQVYLDAFRDLVQEYGQKNAADPGKFLEYWNESGKEKSISAPSGQEAVRILTVHKAKGLEFNVVIIPYCSWELNTVHNTILWCKPGESPFDKLDTVPVYYSSRLKKTHFALDYFAEYLNQYIDNLNLLYVAFTRACRGLYVFCKSGKEDQLKNVSNLTGQVLRSPVTAESGSILPGLFPGNFEETKADFTYGQLPPAIPDSAALADEPFPPVNVKAEKTSKRIQVAYQGKLYLDPSVNRPKRPLNEGKILHEIFMSISSPADIIHAVTALFLHGKINQEEKERYIRYITHLLNDIQVNSWYTGGWKVLTEAEIILPEGVSKRPDRVITRDGQTIIIDYKFGEKEDPAHKKQVQQYISLLSQMGYTGVEGYLWYAMLGKVIRVNEK